MFGDRLIASTLRALGAIALLAACDAYDSSLVKLPENTAPKDAGRDSGASDGGTRQDGGQDACVAQPEACNAIDDDCDGNTDEDTLGYCQSIIVNAETKCVPVTTEGMPEAACVQLRCLAGFDDCDGKPQNGCEKPFCACNDCGDAGEDTDGGGT
jgi:hypothetical protein